MFQISARSLYELISTAQMVQTNANVLISCGSRLNRTDLEIALSKLNDIVMTISGEAFENVTKLDNEAHNAEIHAVFAAAMAKDATAKAQAENETPAEK